jgi:hypothetical protein
MKATKTAPIPPMKATKMTLLLPMTKAATKRMPTPPATSSPQKKRKS